MESELLQGILDDLSELIYISDAKTYDLLYMNDQGMKAFGTQDFHGHKCYELLQGKDKPCEFCTNHLLSLEKYYTWKKTNPITKQTYLLKDKFVNWDGKLARIEIAFNQEDQIKKEEAMQDLLDIEMILVKCITELHQVGDIQSCIQEMLKIVGEFLQADRTYVFLIRDQYMDNAFEWCKEGIHPEIDNLQNLDICLIDRWKESFFNKGQCVFIEDIESIRYTGDEYEILKAQNIHSLIAAPLESNGQLFGYMGVDNPPKSKIEKIVPFFTTLSYFLSSSLIKHQNEIMLKQMSYFDSLTELYNRNRHMEDLLLLEKEEIVNLGVIYIDMNGLKVINDTYGHNYGDVALKKIADVLKEKYDKKSIYRLGGDEFVVLCHVDSAEDFEKEVELLKQHFEENKCWVAIGYQYVKEGKDIEDALKEADEMMYEDKKQYYRDTLSKRYRHYNDEYVTQYMKKKK